jgi:hypothetical protein
MKKSKRDLAKTLVEWLVANYNCSVNSGIQRPTKAGIAAAKTEHKKIFSRLVILQLNIMGYYCYILEKYQYKGKIAQNIKQ